MTCIIFNYIVTTILLLCLFVLLFVTATIIIITATTATATISASTSVTTAELQQRLDASIVELEVQRRIQEHSSKKFEQAVYTIKALEARCQMLSQQNITPSTGSSSNDNNSSSHK